MVCPPDADDFDPDEEKQGSVETKERPRAVTIRRFRVILHNDDYTTMEFVVMILMRFFHRTETEANQIMLSVHHQGKGVAGTYSRDVAETKVDQVTTCAKEHGMPLLVTAEPE